jgi:hypothetical protein
MYDSSICIDGTVILAVGTCTNFYMLAEQKNFRIYVSWVNVYECLIFSNVDATFSFLERCGGNAR